MYLVARKFKRSMLKIKILGSGCARCESLAKLTQKSVDDLKLDATVEKVGDIEEILKYAVMRTPALVVNGRVVLSGEVPNLNDLKNLLGDLSND